VVDTISAGRSLAEGITALTLRPPAMSQVVHIEAAAADTRR
jgi:hypothetical protein